MRLSDLRPRWVTQDATRAGMGINFLCPCCMIEIIHVPFSNPLDGGAPFKDRFVLWERTGDTFENISLTPSIDASAVDASGKSHWHGWIRAGEVVDA